MDKSVILALMCMYTVEMTQMAFTVTRCQPSEPLLKWELCMTDAQLINLQLQLHDVITGIWTKISKDGFQQLVESNKESSQVQPVLMKRT